MTPRDLRAHKAAAKQLRAIPSFKQQKRNKLPRPFHKLGGPRIFCTGVLDVSDDHAAIMFWKTGEILSDTGFFGFLMCRLATGSLSPIFEFHWHPSHKGFHCKTPCNTETNYTDRQLAGAPELSIKTLQVLDPRKESDLLNLVFIFCQSCGISLPDSDGASQRLWL
jgi:hypothetical protein